MQRHYFANREHIVKARVFPIVVYRCESWTIKKAEHQRIYGYQRGKQLEEGSVQSLSLVRLFATPWTAARQASPSITHSQSLLKLMSIELVMLSNHCIFCRPLLLLPSIFPSIRVFQVSQFFTSGDESIGASASASILPMTI